MYPTALEKSQVNGRRLYSKELHSNGEFDRFATESKKPETETSGIYSYSLEPEKPNEYYDGTHCDPIISQAPNLRNNKFGDHMSQDNSSTFKRSEHDKKNPYVMINKKMICDKSISPHAKGVLCFLLSLPDNFKIYHSYIQKELDIGRDSLKSAINELLENGYARRERHKIGGRYGAYQYEFSESKIFIPDTETRTGENKNDSPGEMPLKRDLNQCGFPTAENRPLINNNINNKANSACNASRSSFSPIENLMSKIPGLKKSQAEAILSSHSEDEINRRIEHLKKSKAKNPVAFFVNSFTYKIQNDKSERESYNEKALRAWAKKINLTATFYSRYAVFEDGIELEYGWPKEKLEKEMKRIVNKYK